MSITKRARLPLPNVQPVEHSHSVSLMPSQTCEDTPAPSAPHTDIFKQVIPSQLSLRGARCISPEALRMRPVEKEKLGRSFAESSFQFFFHALLPHDLFMTAFWSGHPHRKTCRRINRGWARRKALAVLDKCILPSLPWMTYSIMSTIRFRILYHLPLRIVWPIFCDDSKIS